MPPGVVEQARWQAPAGERHLMPWGMLMPNPAVTPRCKAQGKPIDRNTRATYAAQQVVKPTLN